MTDDTQQEAACGFCCDQNDAGADGACCCACHASTEDLRYRASLGLCVAALKRIRLRVAVWEEQDSKALEDGIRTLEAHPARSAPESSRGSNLTNSAAGGSAASPAPVDRP